MIRKHSAQGISFTEKDGGRRFYVRIGGLYYYNGNSNLQISSHSRMPNGMWRKTVTEIVAKGGGMRLKELARYIKHYGHNKVQVATFEWTSNQAVYGVPF